MGGCLSIAQDKRKNHTINFSILSQTKCFFIIRLNYNSHKKQYRPTRMSSNLKKKHKQLNYRNLLPLNFCQLTSKHFLGVETCLKRIQVFIRRRLFTRSHSDKHPIYLLHTQQTSPSVIYQMAFPSVTICTSELKSTYVKGHLLLSDTCSDLTTILGCTLY